MGLVGLVFNTVDHYRITARSRKKNFEEKGRRRRGKSGQVCQREEGVEAEFEIPELGFDGRSGVVGAWDGGCESVRWHCGGREGRGIDTLLNQGDGVWITEIGVKGLISKVPEFATGTNSRIIVRKIKHWQLKGGSDHKSIHEFSK